MKVSIDLPRCGLIGAVLDPNIIDAHSQHSRECHPRISSVPALEPRTNASGAAPPSTVVVPVAPPAPLVPPPPLSGASTSTTTTVAPIRGDHREVTIHKEVDENGKTVTEQDIHQEGVSGSTETHTKTETNPETGTTTRSTTRSGE